MGIGVALSGGGFKAAFHIGVLKALEEAGVDVEYISGTSSGAIVAALYACDFDLKTIAEMFEFYLDKIFYIDRKKVFWDFINDRKRIKCISKFDNLGIILEYILGSRDISSVRKKLAVCTVDIKEGRINYFCSSKCSNIGENIINYNGKLCKIVRASAAYPVVFKPTIANNKVLVDGGVLNNLPVNVLKKMGADKVLASNVSGNNLFSTDLTIFSIGMRCLNIMCENNIKRELQEAEYIVSLGNNFGIGMFDSKYIKWYMEKGYCETKKLCNEIQL